MPTLLKYKTEMTIAAIALFHFLVQVFTNGNYGMFRDEYYYIACANNLAWGYVDHPPLSLAILKTWMVLFGDSVESIRLLPALCGSFYVILAAQIAKELGGKNLAQILAALAIGVATGLYGISGFFSMNAFDSVIWALLFYISIKAFNTGNHKLWLLFGVLVGLGLMNKISILFFGLAFVVSVLLSPYRKVLLNKYLWLGGLLAAIIFLPHIIWQFANNWPTLEFMANAKQYKIADLSFLDFLSAQILEMGPVNFIFWMSGLCYLLISKNMRAHRLWGIFFITVFAFLVMQNGKPYYLYPAYFVIFAAGGIAIESLFRHYNKVWLKIVIFTIVIGGGLFAFPVAVPIFPVNKTITYMQAMGITIKNAENSTMGALPQHYADRFGWEEMAAEVSEIYKSLPPQQQNDCVVVTSNYGEAGAINYWSKNYPLPKAISQHNNYYLWGPDKMTNNSTVIVLGQDQEELEASFDNVKFAKQLDLKYAMPYEARQTIYICSGLKGQVKEAWKRGKRFI
jgi:4-amino-4-deoxy-L-arabinose transferase-like glycosyltransferase